MNAPAPSFSWNVGALPFVWGPLAAPTNAHGLPTSLPFALEISPDTGALVQSPNEKVSGALSRAYSEGSLMVGLMDEEGIGREYAEDFLRFLTSHVPRGALSGMRVLEIGCGTGYLLHRLRLLGADVWGVEPGAHGQAGARKYELPVVRDFFPSNEIRGTFDLVIMYAVLEHLEREVEEAAATLGASRIRTFFSIIAPTLLPAVTTGFALAFARAVGEYGSIVFISGNIRYKTEIAPQLIVEQLEEYNYAGAVALAVVLMVSSFAMLYVTNLNTVGNGAPVLTGPGIINKANAAKIAALAKQGTR